MQTTFPTASVGPDRAHVPERHRPWYLRLGRERPVVTSGCPEGDCAPGPIAAHDVYCRTHDRLLPFSASAPTRTRTLVVNLLRALVCGVFSVSAQTANPLPMTVLVALAGAAVLGLPLRHYAVGRATALVWWALACGVCTLAAATGTHAHRIIGTVCLALLASALTAWTSATLTDRAAGGRAHRTHRTREPRPSGSPADRFADRNADRSDGRAAGWIASAMATVPATLLSALVLARGPSGWLTPLPEVRDWLLVAAAGGLAGAALAALLAGALDGWGRVDPRTAQAPLPRRPAPLRWRPADRRWHGAPPRSFAGRVKALVLEFRHQLLAAALRVLSFAVDISRLTGHYAAASVVLLLNLLYRQTVLLGRRARMTALCAAHLTGRAAVLLLTALPRGVRTILVPPAALVTAASLVPMTAGLTTDFLTDGGFGRLGAAVLGALACVVLWTVAWAASTGESFTRTGESALRTAGLALPHAVLLTTVGGWVLGLPGTLGHGRIHVGPLTLALTVLVLFFLFRAKPERAPASGD